MIGALDTEPSADGLSGSELCLMQGPKQLPAFFRVLFLIPDPVSRITIIMDDYPPIKTLHKPSSISLAIFVSMCFSVIGVISFSPSYNPVHHLVSAHQASATFESFRELGLRLCFQSSHGDWPLPSEEDL